MSRNSALDSLRGFAVFLMLVDHIADVWLGIDLADP